MKPLLIASTNPGKIKEFEQMLTPLGFNISSLIDSDCPEIEETGLSFIENAIIKARAASAFAGTPALADDSGLCVPALNGTPGIYSARYSGSNATAQSNNQKLLNTMKDLDGDDRAGYFYCALAFVRNPEDPCPIITTGHWDGFIAKQASATQSFGYNPIFYVPDYDCSMAELDDDIRNKHSHRGKALAAMRNQLI
jgi:XTP/dITP diphosphohydrolase